MKRYTELTADAEITLEARRLWPLQAFWWIVSAVVFIFDGSPPDANSPLNVTVRDRRSNRVVYSKGPYIGAEAVAAAKEAARVIGSLGLQGFLNRERS